METRLKIASVMLMAGFFLAGYATANNKAEQERLACGQGWYETMAALNEALIRLDTTAADVNRDGQVNVLDVQLVVNEYLQWDLILDTNEGIGK